MGLSDFNIAHGYTESIVRGMRSSFLSPSDYHHLTQCETLEDCKMNLGETDYGLAVSNIPTSNTSASASGMTPSVLQGLAVSKVSLSRAGKLFFLP